MPKSQSPHYLTRSEPAGYVGELLALTRWTNHHALRINGARNTWPATGRLIDGKNSAMHPNRKQNGETHDLNEAGQLPPRS
jgi:hypothetical protein